MGDDRKLHVVEVRSDVLDTMAANSRERERALRRAEVDAALWHEQWAELLGQVGDLYHRAKARPKGRRFATVLELANLLRVDDERPGMPPVLTFSGETGEDAIGTPTFEVAMSGNAYVIGPTKSHRILNDMGATDASWIWLRRSVVASWCPAPTPKAQ